MKTQLKEKRIAYVKTALNIARNVCDIPVIFFFMKSPRVSQQMAGFLGVVTSAISLKGLWGTKW